MLKSILTKFSALLFLGVFLVACTKEYPAIDVLDAETVNNYIQNNNLNLDQYFDTGIYYKVVNQGTGPDLDFTQKIPLIYTIKTLDGSFTSVDTFSNRYADYFGYFRPDSLREVMKYSGIKQGGSVRIILPSRFAFGKSGKGEIPGNSCLDYTVTAITADHLPDYEDAIMNTYLTANGLSGFTKTASGLYYKIEDPGTGTTDINDDSIITIEYEGKLLNGTVFDKTETGATRTFTLGNLILGWREAIPLIKKGGSIRILVPSPLGYKLAGSGNIPPFSSLDFHIKVTDVL